MDWGIILWGSKERLYADIMAVHPEVTGSCNLVHRETAGQYHGKVHCGLWFVSGTEV